MSVDLAAPVRRVSVGDRVRWHHSYDLWIVGTVVGLAGCDSLHCDNGSPVAPWGDYLGRLARVQCDDRLCQCNLSAWRHICNECQLEPADAFRQPAAGMLF